MGKSPAAKTSGTDGEDNEPGRARKREKIKGNRTPSQAHQKWHYFSLDSIVADFMEFSGSLQCK